MTAAPTIPAPRAMPRLRRVAITGGQGFLGSRLGPLLVAEGLEVMVVEQSPRRRLVGSEVLYGPLADPAFLVRALEGAEAVVHLWSPRTPERAEGAPEAHVREEIQVAEALVEATATLGVPRLLFASSGGMVYGEPRVLPTPESHPLHPCSAYGRGKAEAERLFLERGPAVGVCPLVLRIGNMYGEGQRTGGRFGVVGVFAERMLGGVPLEIWGALETTRDYVHVDDVARAFLLALRAEPEVLVVNVGSGEGTTLGSLVARLAEMTGGRPRLLIHPARGFEVSASVLAPQLAQAALGWVAETPLAIGIARVVAALRSAPTHELGFRARMASPSP